MKWYIIKRLLQIIPVILGVTLIAFSLIHLAPGDPVRTMLGQHATQQEIDETRAKYGLDQPLFVQYFIWLGDVLHGDLGRSILSHEQVTTEIASRFPNTIELAIAAMIFAILIGVVAGIISATKQYSVADYSVMGIALFGISMPVFWLGIMLMMIFGVFLGWLPIGGRIDLLLPFNRITGFMVVDSIITGNGAALISVLRHLILPAIALGTIPMAVIARTTRSSMLEILRQDFIRTERAKGLSERKVIYKHAVRNAMVPVVTVIGLNFGLLLSGAILTETVFSWPGVGRLVVDSVYARDYPLVIGCILVFALVFVIVNLITDLLYTYIDPRIHYD
ncbi:Binding-protein-dependent transport system inner membrane component [uncultured archaeon]|nr:Binding-protein-dependent transport system inner membrane component [uncultured archaeon]